MNLEQETTRGSVFFEQTSIHTMQRTGRERRGCFMIYKKFVLGLGSGD